MYDEDAIYDKNETEVYDEDVEPTIYEDEDSPLLATPSRSFTSASRSTKKIAVISPITETVQTSIISGLSLKNLEEYLTMKKENNEYEVEFRIGYVVTTDGRLTFKNQSFSYKKFNQSILFFRSLPFAKMTTTENRIENMSVGDNTKIRKIYTSPNTYTLGTKKGHKKWDDKFIGLRIAISLEKDIKVKDEAKLLKKYNVEAWRPNYTVSRKRSSFTFDNIFKGIRLDFTQIETESYPTQYTIEIEIENAKIDVNRIQEFLSVYIFNETSNLKLIMPQKRLNIVSDLYKLLGISNDPLTINFHLFENAVSNLGWHDLVDEWWTHYEKAKEPKKIKRLAMTKPQLLYLGWATTVKLDGERSWIYIWANPKNNRAECYLLSKPNDIEFIGTTVLRLKNSLVDGELYNDDKHSNEFWAFDILVNEGRDIRETTFINRHENLSNFIGKFSKDEASRISVDPKLKEFNMYDPQYVKLNWALDKMHEMEGDDVSKIEVNLAIDDTPITLKFDKTILKNGLRLEVRDGDEYSLYKFELAREPLLISSKNSLVISIVDKTGVLYIEEIPNTTGKTVDYTISFFYRDLSTVITYKTDGIILQPISTGYRYSHNDKIINKTLKWKPTDKLTIDFYVEKIREGYYQPYVIKQKSIKFREVGPNNEFSVRLDGGKIDGIDINRKVVECRYDPKKRYFIPVKLRLDKKFGNGKDVAEDIFRKVASDSSEGNLTEATLRGENLFLARKYFNFKKLKFLDYIKGSNFVIDIGSGNGGDLQKWEKVGFNTVFAVEPNETNRKEMIRRFKEMYVEPPFTLRVIPVGIENTATIKEEIDKKRLGAPDAMISFFSLTFLFESQTKVNNLIETLSLLPVDGIFLGMVFDGDKVWEFLNSQSRKKKKTFTSTAFDIIQVSDTIDLGKYGNAIDMDVHGGVSIIREEETSRQREWLFLFDKFKEKMESVGFKLEDTSFLEENLNIENPTKTQIHYYLLPDLSKTFSKMNRFFIFRRASIQKKIKHTPTKKKGLSLRSIDEGGLITFADGTICISAFDDASSFFRAVLYAASKEYRETEEYAPRYEILKDFRKKLQKYLDTHIELFTGSKSVYSKFVKLAKSEEGAKKLIFKKIRDTTEFLGPEIVLELISHYYKVNIQVSKINLADNKYEITKPSYKAGKNIEVSTSDGLKFFTVKRDGKLVITK